MEERQKTSLIRSSILISVLVLFTALIYLQVYRPMIDEIVTTKENLAKGAKELIKLEGFSKEMKPLTEKELIEWKIAQDEIYTKFPSSEKLPKRITFRGSADLFYGTGEPIMEEIPQLFLELLQVMFKKGQKQLKLTATHKRNALTIPASGEGAKPLKLGRSTVKFKAQMGFKAFAGFLAQLQSLPRFIKVTKVSMKPGDGMLKAAITLETYHCKEGVLGDVSG